MSLLIQTLIFSFIIQALFFAYAAWQKTDKVTDLSYGLTFLILSLFALIRGGNYHSYQLLLVAMIGTWSIRLAGYLLIRVIKIGRDKRFDGIRENFFKFAQFWTLQALSVWVISLPALYLLGQNSKLDINLTMILGLIIWGIGLSTETIADFQKFQFKNNPQNKGKWIQTGLWKYSRHPNYFGEMLCWWGIFVYTIPLQSGWSYLTVIGPIFISFLLLFVTGIPTLEKKYDQRYKKNQKYQQYKKKTNLLIPLPPAHFDL